MNVALHYNYMLLTTFLLSLSSASLLSPELGCFAGGKKWSLCPSMENQTYLDEPDEHFPVHFLFSSDFIPPSCYLCECVISCRCVWLSEWWRVSWADWFHPPSQTFKGPPPPGSSLRCRPGFQHAYLLYIFLNKTFIILCCWWWGEEMRSHIHVVPRCPLGPGRNSIIQLVLHGKPILERYCGTQPLKTTLFHVLLVSVLYELCATAGQRVCVQLLSASSLPAARVGVVSRWQTVTEQSEIDVLALLVIQI